MLVGKHAEAEPLLIAWLDAPQSLRPRDELFRASNLNHLGECQVALKKFPAAEKSLRASLAIYAKKDRKLLRRYDIESLLGAALVGQKKFDEAEPFLLSGATVLLRNVKRLDAESKRHVAAAVDRVIDFYTTRGNAGEAAKWRKKREEAFGPPRNKSGR
jgi:hypothetical protein